jgi:hypothetical protein
MDVLKEQPGLEAAKNIIKNCCFNGPLQEFVDNALEILGPVGTGGFTLEQLMKAKQLIKEAPRALEAAQEIIDSTEKIANKNSNVVVTYGVPEVYPGDKPRSTGTKIYVPSEVKNFHGIITNDVLQQTPELLQCNDVDQLHLLGSVDARETNKMADGFWRELPSSIPYVDEDGKKYVEKYTTEEIEYDMTLLKKTNLSTTNEVIGYSDEFEDHFSKTAVLEVLNRIRATKRHGMHGGSMPPDPKTTAITPKVDGCPLFMKRGYAKDACFTRIGDEFECIERSSRIGKKEERKTQLLIELFPNPYRPERAFLLHYWVFGIPNCSGYTSMERMMEKKKITINFKGFDNYEKKLSLEMPTFKNVKPHESDGIVLHQGEHQLFYKKFKTIDVKKESTKKEIEEKLGVKVQWKDGLWEYKIMPLSNDPNKARITLVPLRQRTDKNSENRMENIIDCLGAPDLESVMEMVNDYREKNGIDPIPKDFYTEMQ